ncbi:fungal-specific transcription factor domain-containing protein, partial [Zopfochytrium polystomum]
MSTTGGRGGDFESNNSQTKSTAPAPEGSGTAETATASAADTAANTVATAPAASSAASAAGGTKRSRTARACDPCRKKRIKCSGERPCCSGCRTLPKGSCHYSPMAKKRPPTVRKNKFSILDKRLKTVELVLERLNPGCLAEDWPTKVLGPDASLMVRVGQRPQQHQPQRPQQMHQQQQGSPLPFTSAAAASPVPPAVSHPPQSQTQSHLTVPSVQVSPTQSASAGLPSQQHQQQYHYRPQRPASPALQPTLATTPTSSYSAVPISKVTPPRTLSSSSSVSSTPSGYHPQYAHLIRPPTPTPHQPTASWQAGSTRYHPHSGQNQAHSQMPQSHGQGLAVKSYASLLSPSPSEQPPGAMVGPSYEGGLLLDQQGKSFIFFGGTSALGGSNKNDVYKSHPQWSSGVFSIPGAVPHTIFRARPRPPVHRTLLLPYPPPLVLNLVDQYFEKFHPEFPMLDESAFRTDLNTLLTSPDLEEDVVWPQMLLTFSMMTLMSQFTPATTLWEGRFDADELARDCLSRAKKILFERLEESQLATAQALVVLSLSAAGRKGKGTATWTYMGMAVRKCQELGLHRELKSMGISHPDLTEARMETSRRTWYCVMIAEVYVSLMAGRPQSIDANDWDVSPPRADCEVVTNLIYHAELVGILGSMARFGNRARPAIRDVFIAETEARLNRWFRSINPQWRAGDLGTKWNARSSMLLIYHSAWILLHKIAFGTIEDAVCVQASSAIVDLLTKCAPVIREGSDQAEVILPSFTFGVMMAASVCLSKILGPGAQQPLPSPLTPEGPADKAPMPDAKERLQHCLTVLVNLQGLSLSSGRYWRRVSEFLEMKGINVDLGGKGWNDGGGNSDSKGGESGSWAAGARRYSDAARVPEAGGDGGHGGVGRGGNEQDGLHPQFGQSYGRRYSSSSSTSTSAGLAPPGSRHASDVSLSFDLSHLADAPAPSPTEMANLWDVNLFDLAGLGGFIDMWKLNNSREASDSGNGDRNESSAVSQSLLSAPASPNPAASTASSGGLKPGAEYPPSRTGSPMLPLPPFALSPAPLSPGGYEGHGHHLVPNTVTPGSPHHRQSLQPPHQQLEQQQRQQLADHTAAPHSEAQQQHPHHQPLPPAIVTSAAPASQRTSAQPVSAFRMQ